jgi:hypothetical protein
MRDFELHGDEFWPLISFGLATPNTSKHDRFPLDITDEEIAEYRQASSVFFAMQERLDRVWSA